MRARAKGAQSEKLNDKMSRCKPAWRSNLEWREEAGLVTRESVKRGKREQAKGKEWAIQQLHIMCKNTLSHNYSI